MNAYYFSYITYLFSRNVDNRNKQTRDNMIEIASEWIMTLDVNTETPMGLATDVEKNSS
jgi:hypothetical protein